MTHQTRSVFPDLYVLNPNLDAITLRDGLHEYLAKFEALTRLGLNEDFLDQSKSTIFHYLSTLNGFIRNIQDIVDAIEKRELKMN